MHPIAHDTSKAQVWVVSDPSQSNQFPWGNFSATVHYFLFFFFMHRFDLHQPDSDKIKVSVAVVLPHSMFKQREYKKIIGQSALQLRGSDFEKMFDLSPYLEMMQPIPAPTEVLGKICDQVWIF